VNVGPPWGLNNFLRRLRKMAEDNPGIFHLSPTGVIRDWQSRCPICSLGWHRHQVQSRVVYTEAARLLNLSKSEARSIADAADSNMPTDLRRRLLYACGLREEET
jgi:hypothetical protein